ncbi:MAG TPA: hypothetical protein VMM60_14505 [Ilumatobacter sp.]|nr:hypothetical protein [Ilumatobacter sp.]
MRANGYGRSRNLKARRACLLVIPLIVVACGSSQADNSASSWVPADFARSNQPLYAAIEDELGFGYDAIIAAADRKTAHDARSCLDERGYEVAWIDLVDSISSVALSAVESVRQMISRSSAARSGLASVPVEALDDCIPLTPPAVAELLGLLEPAIASVSDRVRARPEFIDSVNRSTQCRAERSSQSLPSADEKAMQIAQEFEDGAIDQTTALARLDEVDRQAISEETELTQRCGPSAVELERVLVIEEQQAFLEREPDFVPGLGESFGGTVSQLVEYVSAP